MSEGKENSPIVDQGYNLSTEIRVSQFKDSALFVIGNSGLNFSYDEEDEFFDPDFHPDGTDKPSQNPVENIKRATIFAGALYVFLNYFREHGEQYPGTVSGSSRTPWPDNIKTLLGKHCTIKVNDRDKDDVYKEFRFDLREILKDEPLMEKLQLMHKRMIRENYKVAKPAPEHS